MAHVVRSLCSRSALSLIRSHAPAVTACRTFAIQRNAGLAAVKVLMMRDATKIVTFSRCLAFYGPDHTLLDKKAVESRILKVVTAYDKIDASSRRCFGHKAPLTHDLVVERVILVMQLYDKVDREKLKLDSHFTKDLGLDSLDHVEVIMAIEDEFGFEIPDVDAERLMTPADIVQYVCDKEECWRDLMHENRPDKGEVC